MFQLLIADSRSASAGSRMQPSSLAAHEPLPSKPPSASAPADADTTATTSIAPSTKPASKPMPAEPVDEEPEFVFNPYSADLPPGHLDTSGEPCLSFASYSCIPPLVLVHGLHHCTDSCTAQYDE